MSNSKKTIVLVGLMGAGKSSIGYRLAKRLGMDFKDVDLAIEAQENMTIVNIFERCGEEYFRKVEKELIKAAMAGEPCVLATGGGAFINEETRNLIKDDGRSIWLKASFDVLLERVSRRTTRPLLEQGNKEEILRKLYDERCAIYAEADLVVDSDSGAHYKVVNHIIDSLGAEYGKRKAS